MTVSAKTLFVVQHLQGNTSGRAPVHSCIAWSVSAFVFALAATAWAQAQAAPPATAPTEDPGLAVLIAVLRSGGLPAVLAVIAWLVRGWLANLEHLTITVRMHEDDLKHITDKLAERTDS